MNRRAAGWLVPLAVFALVALMLGWVFSVRLGGGDAHPAYSSLRADALGTRALYEALEALPDFRVDRHLKPIARLNAQPRVVFLNGLLWHDWEEMREDELAALNAVAANGGTVVLAFQAVSKAEEEEWVVAEKLRKEREAEAKKKEGKADDDSAKDKKKEDAKKNTPWRERRRSHEPETKSLAEAWQVEMSVRTLLTNQPRAWRAKDAPEELLDQTTWHSELIFKPKAGSPWRRLYIRALEPVAIERPFGRGRIVLLGDAYALSNESMQKTRATGLLAWLIGEHRSATFVESALGLGEENGVGFLARRYGLGGALALLALLAALYLWRRMVAFYPVRDPLDVGGEVALRYEPAAGMTALLPRALGAGGVLPACVEEWRAARKAGGNTAATARFNAAWDARDPKAPPTETYNALAQTLKPR